MDMHVRGYTRRGADGRVIHVASHRRGDLWRATAPPAPRPRPAKHRTEADATVREPTERLDVLLKRLRLAATRAARAPSLASLAEIEHLLRRVRSRWVLDAPDLRPRRQYGPGVGGTTR